MTNLPTLLTHCQQLGFCLGQDDLFLTLSGGTEIKLCHEDDIHLTTPDPAFAKALTDRLRATLNT